MSREHCCGRKLRGMTSGIHVYINKLLPEDVSGNIFQGDYMRVPACT